MRPTSPRAGGTSLIEVMIAMAVLAVGLLAMWHLHVVGITSTAAGRRHTTATALAQELVSGLERLGFDDPLLSATASGSSVGSSGVFGALVDGSGAVRSGAHDFDATPVPGVRLSSEVREKAEASAGYTRRWTVWAYSTPAALAAGSTCGAKIIAVSVVWNDPPFARPREVVLYTQVYNAATFTAGLGGGT